MSSDPIRVGVVGAGRNTRSRHIPGLQAIENVVVSAVCNRSPESSRAVAEEFGIPRVYEEWQELVCADDSDAIVIGTWPYMHARVTLAALSAGKHVMCEARMAMNASEAEEMVAVARRHPQLVTQVVPSPFTLGVDATIRRLLSEGYVGRVLAIEVRAGGSFLDADAPLTWRQDIDLSGMNVLSLGIWYEALVRWVGEAVAVTAAGKTFVKNRIDPESGHLTAVQIPEHIDVIADMACGAQLHMGISAAMGLAGPPEAWIFGEEGTLRLCAGELSGGRKGADALTGIEVPAEERGEWRVEEEFVNAIRGRESIVLTSFETGLKYMRFTEAVHRSMAEGKCIPLTLVSV